jgi:hypothetical protein
MNFGWAGRLSVLCMCSYNLAVRIALTRPITHSTIRISYFNLGIGIEEVNFLQ